MSDIDDDIEAKHRAHRDWHVRTGGPAFPAEGGSDSGLHAAPGMTLRDYFAGQALSGLYACRELQQATIEDHRMPIESFEAVMAAQAYAQADAMLKAREG